MKVLFRPTKFQSGVSTGISKLQVLPASFIYQSSESKQYLLQVNLCQRLLFLHQLTQNMTINCSLNYKFNAWKFQAQTWGEHVVYRNCFWHFKKVFVHNMFSPCIATRRASDTDLPATHKYLPPTYTFSLTYTIYWAT